MHLIISIINPNWPLLWFSWNRALLTKSMGLVFASQVGTSQRVLVNEEWEETKNKIMRKIRNIESTMYFAFLNSWVWIADIHMLWILSINIFEFYVICMELIWDKSSKTLPSHSFSFTYYLLVGWQQYFYFKKIFIFRENLGSINELFLYFL